jgi:spore coat protein H
MLNCKLVRIALLLAACAARIAPAAGPGAGTAHAPADGLFTNQAIRHLRIDVLPDGLDTLRTYRWRRGADPEDRPSVHATVREGGDIYTNVALHLKGAAGSFRSIDSTKPGFTLNFDKFAEGQRFHGLDKLSLNNSVQDDTFISEKLCRELFARAGVPAPRADYATVELNGRPLGLYVLTEGWDRRFLKRQFQNPKGNLYDPGMGRDIDSDLRVACGENPEDQSELKALAAAAADPDHSNRLARLEQRLDFDRFLSFLALEVLLWHWDGYTMNLNNYRVFHDLDSGRVVFLPHGMDQMFWTTNGPIMVTGRSLLPSAILQTPEGQRRYLERLAQLRTNLLDVPALTNRVRELAARIRPALRREDRSGRARYDYGMGLSYEERVDQLCERIAQRARSVDEQLEGARHLLRLAPGDSIQLTNWNSRRASGSPFFDRSSNPAALHVRLKERGVGAWFTTVWLVEGRYRIEGRAKTSGVEADTSDSLEGTGLRVTSSRKQTDGLEWGWFPLRRGRDPRRRAEVQAPGFTPKRLVGTRDWTEVVYRIDLRQPMADLDVLYELRADSGEAWFDPGSIRLVREK